jgi:NADH-quinone oxidoreductase subunit N
MSFNSFLIISPVATLFVGSICILFSSMFINRKQFIFYTAVAIFVLSIMFSIINLNINPTGLNFSQTYLNNPIGSFLEIFFSISGLTCIVFSYYSYDLRSNRLLFGDYSAITMAVLGSAMILVHSIDLVLIFVALETIAICQYILVSLPRTKISAEAGIKYLLNGAIATAIFSYGLVFLWGSTASTNIIEIGQYINYIDNASIAIYLFSILLMTIGIGFKMGLIPFHGWIPDVYYGGPTNVVAFLSVVSKGTAFSFFAIFSFFIVNKSTGSLFIWWSGWISLIAIVSMTLGNIAAAQSSNVKKLLAFSSIAHAGYFSIGLIAIILGNEKGIVSILLYLLAYSFANFLVFFIAIVHEGSFKGLFYKNKFLAIILTIALLSLTGIPPFMGFIGKFYLFFIVYNPAYWWTSVLVFFSVVNTIFAAYYYFNWIKIIFSNDSQETASNHYQKIPMFYYGLFSLLSLAIIFLGIYPQPIISYISDAVDLLKDLFIL